MKVNGDASLAHAAMEMIECATDALATTENRMLGGLEAWHLVLAIVGVGLSILGWGFTAWSHRLSDVGERLDKRLNSLEEQANRRWNDIERKMDRHETRIHDLHVQVERRVTTLEARMIAFNPGFDRNPNGQQ